MWQMVFANVLVKRWTIDSYGYWHFYGFSKVLVLPSHYTEVVNCCSVTCDITMVTYRRATFLKPCVLEAFYEPLSVLEELPVYS